MSKIDIGFNEWAISEDTIRDNQTEQHMVAESNENCISISTEHEIDKPDKQSIVIENKEVGIAIAVDDSESSISENKEEAEPSEEPGGISLVFQFMVGFAVCSFIVMIITFSTVYFYMSIPAKGDAPVKIVKAKTDTIENDNKLTANPKSKNDLSESSESDHVIILPKLADNIINEPVTTEIKSKPVDSIKPLNEHLQSRPDPLRHVILDNAPFTHIAESPLDFNPDLVPRRNQLTACDRLQMDFLIGSNGTSRNESVEHIFFKCQIGKDIINNYDESFINNFIKIKFGSNFAIRVFQDYNGTVTISSSDSDKMRRFYNKVIRYDDNAVNMTLASYKGGSVNESNKIYRNIFFYIYNKSNAYINSRSSEIYAETK